MNTLFVIGLLLIAAFGFASSAYLSFYYLNWKSLLAKGTAFVFFGVIISLVTFTLSLIIVWPGV